MKLKRVNGGKGKRWKKGHSCVSNPQNTNFREAAKGNFFQKLDEESGLTEEALAKHTAALELEPKLCADPEDDKSIGKTFNTFATNFTTCTIPAFEKFFKNFTIESDLHTRMLAIHATAQEYIQGENLTESPTSYMCALMVTLEGVKESEEEVIATLSLLVKVIRKVSKEVLKAKFGEFSKTFDEIFTTFSNTSKAKLLINIIGCLSILLRAQEEMQWTYPYTMNLFQKILSFTTHENSDIRMTAQYNIRAILQGSSFLVAERALMNRDSEMEEDENEEETKSVGRIHPAASSAAKFTLTNLKLASDSMNGKATLYLLVFMQHIIKCLPEKALEQCCARLLGIMHIADAVVTGRCYKVLRALFCVDRAEVRDSRLRRETCEALVNALTSSKDVKGAKALRLVPSRNNDELSLAWLDVMAAAIIHLTILDEATGINRFCLWMEQLVTFWRSDYEMVHEKVYHVIDYIFDECVKPLKERVCDYAQVLLSAFKHIESCLSLQFEAAWPYVFSSLSPFLLALGPSLPSEFVACVKSLAALQEKADLKGKRQLEKALGAAVVGMGPEEVLKAVPLQVTGDVKNDEEHFWILPLLRQYVKRSRLRFFEARFVHLASKCFVVLDSLKKAKKETSILYKTYQLIERQIWALLPSFADEAVDLEEALTVQSFAKLLCDHIKLRPDTRIHVMAALRSMLAHSGPEGRLAAYAKNYLPALFNVYLTRPRDKGGAPGEVTVEPGQRLAAMSTIRAYLPVVPSAKVLEFFHLIMQRQETEEDLVKRTDLLSLARAFLPFLDENSLVSVYQKATEDVALPKSQKAAYRLLEDLLSTESPSGRIFVTQRVEDLFDLFFERKLKVRPNSRAARLKCLGRALQLLPEEWSDARKDEILKQVVEEAVAGCSKLRSAATRKAAFGLLSDVGKTSRNILDISYEDTFHYCLSLLPPLTPPSDLTPDTVMALMAMTYKYKDLVTPSTLRLLTKEVSQLLSFGNRALGHPALSFLRLIFVIFPPTVTSDLVADVVGHIVALSPEARKKMRNMIRDIVASLSRKFGSDRIKALLPKDDFLQKMLSNVLKRDKAKRRARRESGSHCEGEPAVEAPSSLDEVLAEIDKEIENDEARCQKEHRPILKAQKKHKETWIMENEEEIVDLLDDSLGHVTTRRPRPKQLRFEEAPPKSDEERYGFKVDKATKKFVIVEHNSQGKRSVSNEEDEDLLALEEINEFVSPEGSRGEGDPSEVGGGAKRKRKISQGSEESTRPAAKFAASSGGQKRPKTKANYDYGSEFRSKGGGDVTRKGGIAPYAYVQLSKDKLNRRKRAKYDGQFKSLVRGAKKGAVRGSKLRKAKRK